MTDPSLTDMLLTMCTLTTETAVEATITGPNIMGMATAAKLVRRSRILHQKLLLEEDVLPFSFPFFLLQLAEDAPDEPAVQLVDHSLPAKHSVTALCCWAETPMVVLG